MNSSYLACAACAAFILYPKFILAEGDINPPPTEIYIKGAISDRGLSRVGKPSSVVMQEKLIKRPETTLGELLTSEPGFSGSHFAPAISRPIIRGQSGQRVTLRENGLPSGDVSALSDDHAVSLDPVITERIEILRGPSALLYGGNVIGGAVNSVDESISQERIHAPLFGRLSSAAGSNTDRERNGAASLKGQQGPYSWHLSGSARTADDIKTPYGTVENSHINSDRLASGVSHVWKSGFFGLAVKRTDSDYGIPGSHHSHSHEEDEVEAPLKINLNQTRIESRGQFEIKQSGLESARFALSLSDYEHNELEGDEAAARFRNNSAAGRAELSHRHQNLEGVIGLDTHYSELNVFGEEAFVPPSSTFHPALFLVEDLIINRGLKLQFGGRYAYTAIEGQSIPDVDFNVFSLSTSIIKSIDPDDVYTIGLTAAYSERAPSAAELYADGIHGATQVFELGNPSLKPERSAGLEATFSKRRGRLTGSLTAFGERYLDYINLNPTGEERKRLPLLEYFNQEARFYGIESEVDLEVFNIGNSKLNLSGQIEYLRADNLTEGTSLPRIPPLGGELGATFSYRNIKTDLTATFVKSQRRTAEFESSTPGHNLLNAGLAYKFGLDNKSEGEIFIRGTNLTDEKALVHTSFLKDEVPIRGRSALIGLTIRY